MNKQICTGLIFLHLILLFSNSDCFGQAKINAAFAYQEKWDSFNQCLKIYDHNSALNIARQIYRQALSENNDCQVVKALQRISIQLVEINRNRENKTIEFLEEQIKTLKFSTASIARSMLVKYYAELNFGYNLVYSEERDTHIFVANDLRTWKDKDFTDRIITLLNESIQPEKELQKIPLSRFECILDKGNMDESIRPTLFDFLVHNGLQMIDDIVLRDYLSYDVFPRHEEIIGKKLMVPIDTFLAISEIYDPYTRLNMSLIYFKYLLRFHLSDNNKNALGYTDLERVEYVFDNYMFKGKDKRYFENLMIMSDKYDAYPVFSEILHNQANMVFKGYRPQGVDSAFYLYSLALQYCNKAIDKFPNSSGADKCKELKGKILMKSLATNMEKLIPSNKPVQALVTYRNIDEIYFRIVAINHQDWVFLNTNKLTSREYIEYLSKLKPVINNYQKLPLPDDHLSHRTEIVLPPLNYGNYVCIVSNRSDFAFDSNNLAYTFFSVSDLRLINLKQTYGSVQKLYTLDASTGKPMSNVKIEIAQSSYNYSENSYRNDTIRTTSNQDGYAEFVDSFWGSYFPEITLIKGFDSMNIKSSLPKGNTKVDMTDTLTCFYTDRSIYRPGQTIYYKGIMATYDQSGSNICALKNYLTTITIAGPNYFEEIARINVITNEFGSFSGSYIMPLNAQTGEYRLCTKKYDPYGDFGIGEDFGFANKMIRNYFAEHDIESEVKTFYVEEYRQPKFEIKFDPVNKAYRLKDTVFISGKTTSFSGAAVADAKVIYNVLRDADLIYSPDYYYSYYLRDQSIVSDTIFTDHNGNFTLKFVTLPDTIIPQDINPIFIYTANVTVTDINNESHTASTVVKAGYTALIADLTLEKWISVNKDLNIPISTKNLNENQVNLNARIDIYRIEQPSKPVREKFWKSPDQFILSEKEYKLKFPNDPYTDNDNEKSLRKRELVLSIPVATYKSLLILSKTLQKLGPGEYDMVFLAIDTFQNKLEIRKSFCLFDEISRKSTMTAFSYFIPVVNNVEPGNTAKFIWGSAIEAQALYFVERKGEVIQSGKIKVNNGQTIIEIPIKEADRGNIFITVISIIENRTYNYYELIKVPWTNKKLEIQLTSFRTVLDNGNTEKWSVKITGLNKKVYPAELLAGMYDAALDVLKPNEWKLDLYLNNARYSWFSSNTPYEGYYSHNTGSLCKSYYHAVDWKFDLLNKDPNDWNPYTEPENLECDSLPSDYERLVNSEIDERWQNKVPLDHSLYISSGGMYERAGPDNTDPLKGNLALNNIRNSLKETAFFFPALKSDKNGEVSFEFSSPAVLSRWKFMILAHTQDMKIGYQEAYVVSQRKLMVTTNNPRFFRAGDEINLTSKLNNLADNSISGKIYIRLLDPYTKQKVNSLFNVTIDNYNFELGKKDGKQFSWKLTVPENMELVTVQIIAQSDTYTDGEENTIPVLPQKILLTESLPLFVTKNKPVNYKFDKLMKSDSSSTTLQNRKLILEVTPNPVWYAVMSLPYLMESPNECTDEVFDRFYANSLSHYISKSNPDIKKVFEHWKNTPALISPLEENRELKSILLSETPWLTEAKSETEQRQRLGNLFDDNNISKSLQTSYDRLSKLQNKDGSWPWFDGMMGNRYITQYIVSGLGHLYNLGIKPITNIYDKYQFEPTDSSDDFEHDLQIDFFEWIVKNSLIYIDSLLMEDYNILLKRNRAFDEDFLNYITIQYFYSRSFYPQVNINKNVITAYNYWKKQLATYWRKHSLPEKSMIALSLNRMGDTKTAKLILKTIKDNALYSEESGMYWEENKSSWYVESNSIQTQALLIEAFSEIEHDTASVDKMKVWLLKQKQTQSWGATSATADACYALILTGNKILSTTDQTRIWLADSEIIIPKEEKEAGTGYYTKSWMGKDIKPEFGKIRMVKNDMGVSWGAMHWQYYENIENVTPYKNPLKIEKQVYQIKSTTEGENLYPISNNQILKTGDKILIKLILSNDRPMNFVCLKDMRAASLEPESVFSGYEYRDNAGYYISKRDASFNYFFDYLPQGTRTLEYTLIVNQEGTFQNGIATVQCMYAPEFNSHSSGLIIKSVK
jgi:hypothetical protein